MAVNPIPLPQQTWGDSTANAIQQERDRRFQERLQEARLNMQKYGIDVGSRDTRYGIDQRTGLGYANIDSAEAMQRKRLAHDENQFGRTLDYKYYMSDIAQDQFNKNYNLNMKRLDEDTRRWNTQDARAGELFDRGTTSYEQGLTDEAMIKRNVMGAQAWKDKYDYSEELIDELGGSMVTPNQRNQLFNPLTWDPSSLFGKAKGYSLWDAIGGNYESDIKSEIRSGVGDYNPYIDPNASAEAIESAYNKPKPLQGMSKDDLWNNIDWSK